MTCWPKITLLLTIQTADQRDELHGQRTAILEGLPWTPDLSVLSVPAEHGRKRKERDRKNWNIWNICSRIYTESNLKILHLVIAYWWINTRDLCTKAINPILTGGGGQFDPPVRNPRLPRDRRRSRHAFSWVFSFKSYASFDIKFAKIGPSVARSHDVLYSHVGTKFAQNLHFA